MPSPRRSIGEVSRDWLGAATDVLNRGLVAGVVGAPVDIASTVLRPFIPGIGESPVGGSEWIGNKMQQAGMVSSKRRPIAEFAASLIDPATAPAAIAKGTALGAAKLSMLPLAIGQTVWHGSPHKFDKFDSSKIGTGEGAQAYGYGLYLAEDPRVAQTYKDALSGINSFPTGNKATNPSSLASRLAAMFGNDGTRWTRNSRNIEDIAAKMSKYKEAVDGGGTAYVLKDGSHFVVGPGGDWWDVADGSWAPQGQLYKVDLPDDAIAKMLDWDKPMRQQHPEVIKAWKATKANLPPNAIDDLGGDLSILYGKDVTPEDFLGTMSAIGGSASHGEKLLRDAGIPGIRYLDGGSRGTGQGTSNFVVFPGNEGLLTILERNGVPIVPEPK